MEGTVKAFPRGNAKGASNEEQPVRIEQDTLFGTNSKRRLENVVVKHQKSKKSKNDTTNLLPSSLPKVGLGMTKSVSEKNVQIEELTFRRYVEGVTAMGYVLSVDNSRLLVSLPNGVTGSVSIREVSDVMAAKIREATQNGERAELPSLLDIFTPHQPVRCCVLGTKGEDRKHLQLSLRASLINKGLAMKHLLPGFPVLGSIVSAEDHGYVVSLGLDGVVAFIPHNLVPKKKVFTIGEPVECVVDSVNDAARTVTLKTAPATARKAAITSRKLAFRGLSAGMLVDAIVDREVQNGLLVTFLASFHGMIDNNHFAELQSGDDWRGVYKEGDTLKARIIFVDYVGKSVRLSLKPHVVNYYAIKNLPSPGQTLQECEVIRVDRNTGLLLKVATAETAAAEEETSAQRKPKRAKQGEGAEESKAPAEHNVAIRVHISQVDDSKISSDELARRFKVGNVTQCRVIGLALVEGWLIGSCKPSMINNEIVHKSQVEVGQTLEGVVTAVTADGTKLRIGGAVEAFCPAAHLSDAATKNVVKRFKVGTKLTVRVWEVTRTVITVTHKPSLVKEEEPLLVLDDVQVGKVSTGVVSRISEKGLDILFFNNIRGRIPMSVLVKQGVNDPTEAYRVGQPVRCVVLRVQQVTERRRDVTLGLDVAGTDELAKEFETAEETTKPTTALSADGTPRFVTGSVIKHESQVIVLRLEDGTKAVLPYVHLCDVAQYSVNMSKQYEVGAQIKDMLVLGAKPSSVLVTLKPLLLQAARGEAADHTVIPQNVADVTPGQVVAGYVIKVEEYGVIVKFRGSLTALAPRPNIADKFISTPVGLFQLGDTVRAVVQRVDLNRERVIVTFKSAYVPPSPATYLSSLLREQTEAAKSDELAPDWRNCAVGTTLDVAVASLQPNGVALSAPGSQTVMLATGIHAGISQEGEGAPFKVGDSVKVRVLAVDFATHVLDVTTLPEVVKGGRKKRRKEAPQLEEGAQVEAMVLLKKPHYLVVAVKDTSIIGFVQVADFHNPSRTTEEFQEGSTVTVVVQRSNRPGDEVSAMSEENADPYSAHPLFVLLQEQQQLRTAQQNKIQQDAQESDAKLKKKKRAEKKKQQADSLEDVLERLRPGCKIRLAVQEIDQDKMLVAPAGENSDKFHGVVHITGAIDRVSVTSEPGVAESPFAKYQVGDVVSCKVLTVRASDAENAGEDEDEQEKKEGSDEEEEDGDGEQVGTLTVQLSLTSAEPQDLKEDKAARSALLAVPQWRGRNAVQRRQVHRGVIVHESSTGYRVALAPGIVGHVSYLDIADNMEEIERFRHAAVVGMPVTVVVVDVIPFRRVRLSIAALNDVDLSAYGSCLPLRLPEEVFDAATKPRQYKAGDLAVAMIDRRMRAIRPPALMLRLIGSSARVCITEMADREEWLDMPLGLPASTNEAAQDSGAEDSDDDASSDAEEHDPFAAAFPYSDEAGGSVDVNERSSSVFPHGKVVMCRIITVTGRQIEASLRKSRTDESVKRRQSTADDALPDVGSVLRAYVTAVTPKGCFLRASRGTVAKVMIKDLADGYVREPAKMFPAGRLVVGVVKSINDNKQLEVSLRRSEVVGEELKTEVAKLKKGMTVTGRVVKVTATGVFVAINNTALTGLSRKVTSVSNPSEDLTSIFEEGDIVRAKVLRAKDPRRILLGLKPSFFTHGLDDWEDSEEEEEQQAVEEAAPVKLGKRGREEVEQPAQVQEEEEEEDGEDEEDEEDEAEDGEDGEDEEGLQDDEDEAEEDDRVIEDVDEEEEEEEEEDQEDEEEDDESEETPMQVAPPVDSEDEEDDNAGGIFGDLLSQRQAAQTRGLQWTTAEEDAAAESEESEQEDAGDRKKGSHKTRQKEAQRRREEAEIERRERALMNDSATPETPEDFERLLLAEPNSSLLWIQYMAFQLQLADIEAARRVAERALKTIQFREEEEKYNVWVALLNLEYKYGSQDSLQQTFQRATQFNNSKRIHMHMAEMYEKAKDVNAAEEMYKLMLKRFKYSKKVWMAYQHFKLRQRQFDEAHDLLKRSLQSLAKHKHVLVTMRFAQEEFDIGSQERGRTLFEGLLANYPKRTDLWIVYVDQESKHGNYDRARRLYERMTTAKMSSRAMRNIFKKFLRFEMQHGNEETVEHVKTKAREYVQAMS